MVDESTRKIIEHGRRIRAVLGQRQFAPLALGEHVALLCALSDGVLDAVPLDRVSAFRAGLAPCLAGHCPEVLALDDRAGTLSDDLRARLKAALVALCGSVGTPATPGAQP
jgi:F0F1-type ATP synthase alpha subunit